VTTFSSWICSIRVILIAIVEFYWLILYQPIGNRWHLMWTLITIIIVIVILRAFTPFRMMGYVVHSLYYSIPSGLFNFISLAVGSTPVNTHQKEFNKFLYSKRSFYLLSSTAFNLISPCANYYRVKLDEDDHHDCHLQRHLCNQQFNGAVSSDKEA
jgi:hypothetical protein